MLHQKKDEIQTAGLCGRTSYGTAAKLHLYWNTKFHNTLHGCCELHLNFPQLHIAGLSSCLADWHKVSAKWCRLRILRTNNREVGCQHLSYNLLVWLLADQGLPSTLAACVCSGGMRMVTVVQTSLPTAKHCSTERYVPFVPETGQSWMYSKLGGPCVSVACLDITQLPEYTWPQTGKAIHTRSQAYRQIGGLNQHIAALILTP